MACKIAQVASGRSREGAWIEIPERCLSCILCDSRSREGAWIEINNKQSSSSTRIVAPVRERGLKFITNTIRIRWNRSLP